MTKRFPWVLLAPLCWLLAGCTAPSEPVALTELCQDPRIVAEIARTKPSDGSTTPGCLPFKVRYREDGKVVDIPGAAIFKEYAFSIDVYYEVWKMYIQLPSDEIVFLDESVPPGGDGYLWGYSGLAYTSTLSDQFKALDICSHVDCPSFNELFVTALERRIRRLCFSYEMKPPFRGSYSQCADGPPIVAESLAYDPAAARPQEAVEIACARLAADTDIACTEGVATVAAKKLEVRADGSLAYLLRVYSYPCRWYEYEVDPMTRSAMLVKSTGCN